MVPRFGTHKTRWAFQICSVNSQFKGAQSWIFSTLLFSKSFISFSIRATLYLSSWNFATGTWNRPFVLENMKGPFQELRLGQVCGLGTASAPSLLHFFLDLRQRFEISNIQLWCDEVRQSWIGRKGKVTGKVVEPMEFSSNKFQIFCLSSLAGERH